MLKHDMAHDYILAKQVDLCVALYLTGDADCSDIMTSVTDAVKLRDAFGPSDGAGWSANVWFQNQLGPMGAVLVQILVFLYHCV